MTKEVRKMIIDFHTHVFPDELAPKALASLTANLSIPLAAVSDMTSAGLIRNMDAWAVDISVNQPVITKFSQTVKSNEWARSIQSEKIISFGGIYPHTDDYKRDIDFVADLGLKGIKFHAEYQNFVLDEKKMLDIYFYALSKGLIVLHHAGVDIGMPEPYKSSPRQFANVARLMRGGIIVAAHLGGHRQWDDVEKYLAGENIYLDTSMGFDYFSHSQFVRIVEAHGSGKILFASDSPWSNAKTEIEQIRSLPISETDKLNILGLNAKRILKI